MQNKIVIGLAVALLAVLASWGSREHTHIKETESWTVTKTQLEAKVTTLTSQNTQLDSSLKRSVASRKKTIPIVLSNGETALMTEESSETVEEAMSSLRTELQTKIDSLTKQNTDLAAHIKEKETDIKKAAPLWNVVASSSIMGYADVTQWQLGGGLNIGGLSLSLTNPLVLSLEPRLQGMVRF